MVHSPEHRMVACSLVTSSVQAVVPLHLLHRHRHGQFAPTSPIERIQSFRQTLQVVTSTCSSKKWNEVAQKLRCNACFCGKSENWENKPSCRDLQTVLGATCVFVPTSPEAATRQADIKFSATKMLFLICRELEALRKTCARDN